MLSYPFDKEIRESTYVKCRSLSVLSSRMYGQYDLLGREVKQLELSAVEKENDIIRLSSIDEAMKLIETEPAKGYVDLLREDMEEARKAEKMISYIRNLCENNADIKSNRAKIKECYDKILLVRRAVSMFYVDEIENTFIEDIASMSDTFAGFNRTYNMVRNYCTRNPIQKNSRDMFFNKGTFLSSFDTDRFKNGVSLSTLLRKDGMYYLYVMNPEKSTRLSSTAYVNNGGYDRLVYKQLTGINKIFPKCFVLSKDATERYGLTEEIREIVAEKKYTKEAADRESCEKWIDYCIKSFKKNVDWMRYYNVPFKKAEEYESANDFYTQTEKHS